MSVRVRVPASIANFGPAFDVLAVAVTLYNEVSVTPSDHPSVTIDGEGEDVLLVDASNLVYRAAAAVAARAGHHGAFAVRCRNRIPLGRGLGSSAAAIVGGAVAANEMLGRPVDGDELLQVCAQMEGHPDNVSAGLFGGVVLTCATNGRLAWTRLTPGWNVGLVVAIPGFEVPTTLARQALPARVPLHDAVANVARTGWLVTAVVTGRPELLAVAMEDFLHQPYRKVLVPGLDEVFAAARTAGAYAAALCGSGPSVVAVVPHEVTAAVGAAMVAAFSTAGHEARYIVLAVDHEGAKVVS